ncbi:MAG: DNA repair protein RadC [Flavobacteriales bacterium]|nr:DNA repair protein RadC [Flavobacteriales bacterium]
MIIKEWNEDDRPREKLFLKGRSALSEAELLAILIGSGNRKDSALGLSRKVLSGSGSNLATLSQISYSDLMKVRGIGKAKAAIIIAALELGRRRKGQNSLKKMKLSSSGSVFELMQPLIGELEHEEFWILLLNNANKLKFKWRLSMGGITATLVDVRLIYKKALEQGATSIILCHNHPSGNLKPSQSDIILTKKVIHGGGILDIKVLDHIIVTECDYYSFADDGKL